MKKFKCTGLVLAVSVLVLASFTTAEVPQMMDQQGRADGFSTGSARCCSGMVGDVNCADGDTPDVADIQRLIDFLFISMDSLCCVEEADLNLSGQDHPPAVQEDVDIGDMQLLIDYLFIDLPSLPLCGYSPGSAGELLGYSGCKEFPEAEHVLSLTHINAMFNCCPEIGADISIDSNTITIEEIEFSGICDCLCLFDLEYRIPDLPPGEYRIIVLEPYLPNGDEPVDFIVDLVSSPSGIHCVSRSW